MKKNNILVAIILSIILIIVVLILLIYNAEKYKNIENDLEGKINDDNIQIKERYDCNEFKFISITTENLMRMYLNDYKDNLLNNTVNAYNLLNKEYREKRFGTIEEYQKYVNKNIDMFRQMNLSKYEINKYDDYEEYVCVDQYNNFYIFEVTAVMKYSVRLDTYTVDSKAFIDEYNKAGTQQKVMMNIQKIFKAIEFKGYEYVYNKLDASFRNNNYRTLEEFSSYIEKNIYSKNSITFTKFSNEGDTYIYIITIIDANDKNKEKNMTIIMQLKEKTDFVMSFSFK